MMGRTRTARSKYLGLMAAVGGLLALWPTSSFAAPIGGVNEARIPSAVSQVRYQCWWADGNRHCADIKGGDYDHDRRYRDYDRPHYGHYRPYYDYGYHLPYYGYHRVYRPLKRPEAYRPGSLRWWRSMEVYGRTGTQ
jgi:hypothetical protein